MNELSLFSGAGGGLLATKHLLGWRTIGYVEFNDYCQKVISQRIKDGLLDDAPIFGDIRAFLDQGYCELYRGVTDVVTAGWPCPPVSIAGDQRGKEDERWLWPSVKEAVRIIKPNYFFGENVPGLLSANAGREFSEVLWDLAEIGYDVKWLCLSAKDCGAWHRRDRVWILAYPNGSWEQQPERIIAKGGRRVDYSNQKVLADTEYGEVEVGRGIKTTGGRCGARGICEPNTPGLSVQKKEILSNDAEPGLEREVAAGGCGKHNGLPSECSWWKAEPDVGRVVHGLSPRVDFIADRIKCLGNAQVPIVAATAWKILTGEMP